MGEVKKQTTGPPKPSGVIAARVFKTHCLSLLDEVAERHREFVITRRGKPVAKLVPYREGMSDSFGALHGTVEYHGKVVEPDHRSWQATVD